MAKVLAKIVAKTVDWIHLLRVRQWYKNVVIFLAIFFVGELFDLPKLLLTAQGFVALCAISSAGYLINDLVDLQKDQLHPEKKNRPLAAGRITPLAAVVTACILVLVGSYIAWHLNIYFLYCVLLLFFLTQIYTFILKNIVIADILTIAVLFVIRAISGPYIIGVVVSPWLILCPFFLSLFLSVGKRQADLQLLGDKAGITRKVLQEYTLNLTNNLMIISTTLLILAYSLYSFLSKHEKLLYTLPFAMYVIFRYFYVVSIGSEIARHPERVLQDKSLVAGIVLWVICVTIIIYSSI